MALNKFSPTYRVVELDGRFTIVTDSWSEDIARISQHGKSVDEQREIARFITEACNHYHQLIKSPENENTKN